MIFQPSDEAGNENTLPGSKNCCRFTAVMNMHDVTDIFSSAGKEIYEGGK